MNLKIGDFVKITKNSINAKYYFYEDDVLRIIEKDLNDYLCTSMKRNFKRPTACGWWIYHEELEKVNISKEKNPEYFL